MAQAQLATTDLFRIATQKSNWLANQSGPWDHTVIILVNVDHHGVPRTEALSQRRVVFK
jgi:hypothetical protein